MKKLDNFESFFRLLPALVKTPSVLLFLYLLFRLERYG